MLSPGHDLDQCRGVLHIIHRLRLAATHKPQRQRARIVRQLCECAHTLQRLHVIQRCGVIHLVDLGVCQRVQAVSIVADEAMDAVWQEPEAFDGCSTKGQSKPGEAQPIHIVRKQAPPVVPATPASS